MSKKAKARWSQGKTCNGRPLWNPYDAPPGPPKIERRCLRCDVTFQAIGKFNRICNRCRTDIDRGRLLPGIEDGVSLGQDRRRGRAGGQIYDPTCDYWES